MPLSRSFTRCFVLCFFEDRIISRRGDVIWPSRSCDMTSLDYYLWGAVKEKCCSNKRGTINALKDNIREVFGEIQLHTIDNMLKYRSCRLLHGHYWVRHITFFSTIAYFVNGKTWHMSDLTDNYFYSSAGVHTLELHFAK